MKANERLYTRVLAISLASLLTIYCGAVLFYVATSADLGLRCLLTNDQYPADQPGVQIREFVIRNSPLDPTGQWLPQVFGPQPQAGDLLLKVADREINTFVDYSGSLAELRTAFRRGTSFDSRAENTNPLDIDRYASLPPVIDYIATRPQRVDAPGADDSAEATVELSPGMNNGTGSRAAASGALQGRYVRIEFQQASSGEVVKAWVRMHPLPTVEVVLSILWCLLELGIFALAVLSYCHRPGDQAARTFFALCFVTLPAFVGGYHWWVIASSAALTWPFAVSAVFLPVVTLHFYLNYPTRHWLRVNYPLASLIGLYTPPVLMTLGLTILLASLYGGQIDSSLTPFHPLLLIWLRLAIDVYIVIAVGYFAGSVLCMLGNYRQCKQTAERKQLQWILLAALVATPLVLYAAYLAYADRVGLALGRGRVPMVVVSLLFLTAYAIGILRYRLMLLDQIISRHMLYMVLSQLVTLLYSLTIAIGSLITVHRGMTVPEQLYPLVIILTTAILAMGWGRDMVQQMIDRRFFREKYRLDRVMQQMNVAVANVADVKTLAERMLRSCREVLQIRFSALYLREGKSPHFNLVCAIGNTGLPARLEIDEDSVRQLQLMGSSQRIPAGMKGTVPLLQQIHRELNSQLLHGFAVEGKLSGLVILGPKASAAPFTAEDTTFVTAIGQMSSVALQCVRVQQNVSRLDAIINEKIGKINAQERQIALLKSQLAAERTLHQPIEQKADPSEFDVGNIRGNSPAIRQVLDSARKVARSESSVLIRGESGTGKELLARALHLNSPRGQGPLVSVNCAALSPTLLESELFGHVKGAFTGAYRDAQGRFQLADGGTLFLDEVGDVPPDVQVKLLRVLQERRIEPVGSRESIPVDVRLIAATHQNLEQLMKKGTFREDLYYRLNVITLQLPPLRDRKEDLFELSLEFLREASEQSRKAIREIDDLAIRALLDYDWPGNIRELHNAIHRAVVLAEGDCILLENLPPEIQQGAGSQEFGLPERLKTGRTLEMVKKKTATRPNEPAAVSSAVSDEAPENEREWLQAALDSCQGNKAQAARTLGLPRSTFYSKLKKYDL